MYICRRVGRGTIVVGGVTIHGLEIQIEPMRKVHDKMEREALKSITWISSSQSGKGRNIHGRVETVMLVRVLFASQGQRKVVVG